MIDGQARGIVVRNMDTGGLERHGAHAVVLATGGFGKIYYLSTLAMDLRILGGPDMNSELEKAGRVTDYLEVGELMCYDALTREESCGAHFREEYQTPDGEAARNDKDFAFTSAWEWTGTGKEPNWHKEPLRFEFVTPSLRSYK
ncbi:MAG TPA: FAD-binding protein [Chthoniobacterales bacterium]|nr:FAD-binding protein [Chthoniobacterales bacterium]